VYPRTHARTTPEKPAVIMAESGEQLTFAALEERSVRLADHLRGLGLVTGDAVALLTDNRPQASEAYWACQRAGLYVTAVNWHLTAAEAAHIVGDCGTRVLIASAELGDLAREVAAATPAVTHTLAFAGTIEGFGDYESALAAADPVPPADQPRGGDLLYSSGTTGRPKGVRPALSGRQVDDPADNYGSLIAPRYGFGPDTVYLSPGPIYHAAPLRFAGVVQAWGGTVVMMRSFDAEEALAAVERHRVTHSQWVPTMFVRMLKLPGEVRRKYDHSSLRVAIHGAAPCPVEVKRAMIDWWGPVLDEYYGATEGIGATFINSAQWLEKPGSVGRAGAMGAVHVVGPDGAELPVGEAGVIYFERGDLPFHYHGNPEGTAAVRHPAHAGWATVGDVGYLDEDGFLFLMDRQSHVIISGGVNIYPREVEDVLALHPAVDDVAVVGEPDEVMGESVLALVKAAPGAADAGLPAELAAYTRERLAHFKCPRRVELVDDLPRTPAGKLLKRTLRGKAPA
jgi:fatty-acyl-CoA synthase